MAILVFWKKRHESGMTAKSVVVSRIDDTCPSQASELCNLTVPDETAAAIAKSPMLQLAVCAAFAHVASGDELPEGHASGFAEVDSILGRVIDLAKSQRT